MSQSLSWGVIGTAKINAKFIPGLQNSTRSKLVGIASRDAAKAEAAAKEWNTPRIFRSYDALLEDKDVDAIYLSLPNHLHHEWTLKALQAGKHVLCEKPLSLRPDDAIEVIQLAESTGLKIAEGFMYRHHAQTIKILELARDGAIGKIRRIRGSFHITIPPGPNIRTDAGRGGGSLWDVGCYIINFANAAVGRAPISAFGTMVENAGYDETYSGILDYGDGATLQIDCGFLGPRIDEFQILGETGWIEVPRPFKPTGAETISIHRRSTREAKVEIESFTVNDAIDPYAAEIASFEAEILDGFPPRIPHWESAAGIHSVEALLSSARTGKPIEIIV